MQESLFTTHALILVHDDGNATTPTSMLKVHEELLHGQHVCNRIGRESPRYVGGLPLKGCRMLALGRATAQRCVALP